MLVFSSYRIFVIFGVMDVMFFVISIGFIEVVGRKLEVFGLLKFLWVVWGWRMDL